MATFFLYILKSGLCLTLFYICFKGLFSNDTFFRFNRWMLLVGVAVCLLLPVIPFELPEVTVVREPVVQLERLVIGEQGVTDELVAAEEVDVPMPVVQEEQKVNIPWGQIFSIFYFAGSLFCLGGTLLSFYRMYRLICSGRKVECDGYGLILTSGPVTPFSWGRYIILSEEDYRNHPDEILTHEKMHLGYHHSRDIIFMEIIVLLHWFNPAVWLLKRELRDIHEYQADKGVLSQGIDATKYQLLLVKKAVGSSLYTLANSFNHSKIKKRITMMLKEKTNSWARLKLLLLVPVGFTALCVFARPEVKAMEASANEPSSEGMYKDTVSSQQSQEDNYYAFNVSSRKSTDLPQDAKKKWNVCYSVQTSENKWLGVGSARQIEAIMRDGKAMDNVIYIQPVDSGVPEAYMEGLKKELETKGYEVKLCLWVEYAKNGGGVKESDGQNVRFTAPGKPHNSNKAVAVSKPGQPINGKWRVYYSLKYQENPDRWLESDNLEKIEKFVANRKFKTPPTVIIQPTDSGIPQSYLDGLKDRLESNNLKADIKPWSGHYIIKYTPPLGGRAKVTIVPSGTQKKDKNWVVVFSVPDKKSEFMLGTNDLDRIVKIVKEEKYDALPTVEITPMEANIPQEYLGGLKKELESKGMKAEIKPYVKGSMMHTLPPGNDVFTGKYKITQPKK